jgi:hypothetical protein
MAETRAAERPVTGLVTLQFLSGGLLDATPVDDYAVHLVRCTEQGTPGPALCGINRFHKDNAGWSLGGGIDGPDIIHNPCPGCARTARDQFPGLEVTGIGAEEMAAALGVPRSHWNGGRFTVTPGQDMVTAKDPVLDTGLDTRGVLNGSH